MNRMPFFLVIVCCIFFGCAQTPVTNINGVSFVASRDSVDLYHVAPLADLHVNYAAVMPFGFIKNLQHPEIVFNTDRQWFGETVEGAKQYVRRLHQQKIEVMLKPQIWIWHGEFTGHLKMQTEDDWLTFEKSYRNFILTFTKLAEEEQVKLLCIGTELEQFVNHRPQFWNELIKEVRATYRGKITYAANWDEYTKTPFWESLDYIGVDAYFPISELKTPELNEAKIHWDQWKQQLAEISAKTDRPILFTEYGYRSVDFAGKEPWVSDRNRVDANMEAQRVLLEAQYESVWSEPWFAGGFLWKWFIDHPEAGGMLDTQFSPQNKPALEEVRKQYSKKD